MGNFKPDARIIGDFGPVPAHTLVVFLAGIHGNETCGITALETVFSALAAQPAPVHGRVVGFRGNLKAIKAGKRYIEDDLNRLWADEFVNIACHHRHEHPEFEELAAIYHVVQSLQPDRYRQKIFLDLHGTSAENGIFTVVQDLAEAWPILNRLHAPVVMGLENGLLNTTVPFMHRHGFVSIAFEGGKIGEKASVQNHMLTIWQVLAHTGIVSENDIPSEVTDNRQLVDFAASLPDKLKLVYAHKIKEGDRFRMVPGFRNYDWVKPGDLLARDRHGEIRAQHSGYMLMPLYQEQGSDGFFIVAPVPD